jgi:hypothetical protein
MFQIQPGIRCRLPLAMVPSHLPSRENSAGKEYSPDFAPKNRPIGGFWRGKYGEIYVISIIYLGPTPNLDRLIPVRNW